MLDSLYFNLAYGDVRSRSNSAMIVRLLLSDTPYKISDRINEKQE